MSVAAVSTALPGRSRELAELASLLDGLRAGRGHLLVYAGEPGIGKTHVLDYAAANASAASCLVARSACFEDAVHAPHLPFRSLVRTLVEALGTAQLRPDPVLHTLIPDLVSRPDDIERFSEAEQRERLLDAVLTVCRRASLVRPLLLIIDDLQWADEATVLLLRGLSRAIGNTSVGIVGAFRDTDTEVGSLIERLTLDLQRERTGVHLALRRLSHDETRSVIAQSLGTSARDVPDPLVDVVFRESEGVPLFVDEWLTYLQEEGYLRHLHAAGWSFGPARGLSAPKVVRRVIDRRLARLEPDSLQLLEVMAVAGSAVRSAGFWDMARDITGRTVAEIDRLLAETLRRQITASRRPTAAAVDRPYLTFAHEQFREAVLERLTSERRRDLHHAIATHIEAKRHEFDDVSETLAFHFARGRDSELAFTYTVLAAEEAHRLLSHVDAVRLYESALELLHARVAELPTACHRFGDRARVLRALAAIHAERDDRDSEQRVLNELRRLTTACGGPADDYELALLESRYLLRKGQVSQAQATARQAMALAGDEQARQLGALIALGESLSGRPMGEPSKLTERSAGLQEAELVYTRARGIAQLSGDLEPVARLDQELGVVIWGAGGGPDPDREERSRAHLMQALGSYRALGNRKGEITALIALAYRRRTADANLAQAHVDSYVSFLEEIRRLRAAEHRLVRVSDWPRSEALALLSIHLFCRTNGWYELALDRATRSLEWATEARDERIAVISRTGLSETERLLGRGARALEQAEAAMAALEHRDSAVARMPGLRDTALEVLAAAHAEFGVGDNALRYAQQRVDEARATEQPSAIAASLAGLAEVLEVLDRSDDARNTSEEALRASLGLAGNITSDIRAELVLARLALAAGEARLALGYSTAAAGKLAQRETPLTWLRTSAHLTRGLALELTGYLDDAVEAVEAARSLVTRSANRISNPALRDVFLSQAALTLATLTASRRMGIATDVPVAGGAAPRPGGLTTREIEILRLVSSGLPNREIADALFISEKTVARHLTNIFNKIDAQSRTQAAAWAYRNGIV